MYEFERPGRPRRWRCGPRARPRWCGPSSSTTRRRRGRPGTSRPPSATSGPRPAATASTTSSAWRCSAPRTPTSTSRSSPWPPTSTPSLGPAAGATWPLNSMGCAECRPRLRRRPARLSSPRTPTSCATSTASASPSTRCGSSTASSPACRAVTDDAPRLVDYLDEPCAAHFARVRAGLDALGIAYRLEPRLVRGLDYYTRTTFEFAGRRPRHRPRTPWAAAAATTAWPRPIGGPPTPGIGFGIGIERLLLACDAEGVLRRATPRRPTPSSST